MSGAPTIRFRLPDGSMSDVTANGSLYSVMMVAKAGNVPGIEGQCGGNRACATCHVYVAPEWCAAVGPPGENERALLALTDAPRPESRLSCQIPVSPQLDGLIVTPVPKGSNT